MFIFNFINFFVMKFNVQFSDNRTRKISKNSGVKHIGFVDERPLSVSEMYYRAVNGIPLSVPKPLCDRIPLNGSFYPDDFDVIDLAIKNTLRFEEESKLKALEESRRRKEELRLFEEWKKQNKFSSPSSSDATIKNGAVNPINQVNE